MGLLVSDELTDGQLEELMELYKGEWVVQFTYTA